MKKHLKKEFLKAVCGCFFVILGMFSLASGVVFDSQPALAVEGNENTSVNEDANDSNEETEAQGQMSEGVSDHPLMPVTQSENAQNNQNVQDNQNNCKKSLGAIGWLVCPTTGKIAETVDFLYDKIEEFLVIKPISAESDSPIYMVWKYCRGLTNIVFIIFLLIVIYSQLTGIGISNYGVKKVLPKLIVAAIMINLSFLICSLAVEVSNVIGNGLRGVFSSVQQSVMDGGMSSSYSFGDMFGALAAGTGVAIGAGVIAFETGAIFMLIPVVLGAVVAVVTGLITIALRQAVVALLIMVSPLAFVAYILPNVDGWFKKWKDLFIKMLEFYPLFSLLFGASTLAGFAIIASAQTGFGLLLGVAVQVFPLFFSWKLMTMSGTMLGSINAKMQGLTEKPLATSRALASSLAMEAKQKHLLNEKSRRPSLRLMAFMNNMQIGREADMERRAAIIKNKGLAYRARSHYKEDGSPTKKGERVYADIIKDLRYQTDIARDEHTMNAGLGDLAVGKRQKARLDKLDGEIIVASDSLKMEMARGAKIEYENTRGYYERVKNANYANVDDEALKNDDKKHQMHAEVLDEEGNIKKEHLDRYGAMMKTMGGKREDVGYILADAAHAYDAQSQVVRGKFSSHFINTEATQDIVNELNALTKNKNAKNYIDSIIAGVRTLNMRGDTDLAYEQLNNLFNSGSVTLGSHAMQAVSNFCMFDVKGSDPSMRRLGKYINLETAKMFNRDDPENRRTRRDISLYEYINGEYINRDENGNIIYNDDGGMDIVKTKKSAKELLKGTSFKDMERTAIKTLTEMIRAGSVDISVDENGNEVQTFNYDKFKKNEEEIWDAILPNVISDHFSFLSGSEQIVAMSKGITGVDAKKHSFDWEGIFGDEAERLTPEQKKDYIDFLGKRTKKFLGGQVPSQIAKTKTDMLASVKNQYALREALRRNPELVNDILTPGRKMSDDDYNALENSHFGEIQKRFVGSFKEDALKGFVKMHHKGYQGEAKDGLIQLLNPDALYNEFFPSGERGRSRRLRDDIEDDEDDGRPVDFGDDLGGSDSPIYNSARLELEDVYRSYRGVRRTNVVEFWREIKPVVQSIYDNPAVHIVVEHFEDALSQYTDVSELYADIVNMLFGGFEG